MTNRTENLPSSILSAVIGVTLSKASFLVLEDIFRCYLAELGPQAIAYAPMVELHNAGLITAPKGHGGNVIPTDKAFRGFGLVVGDTDASDLSEPRNAFEGVFVPRPVEWFEASDALPAELRS